MQPAQLAGDPPVVHYRFKDNLKFGVAVTITVACLATTLFGAMVCLGHQHNWQALKSFSLEMGNKLYENGKIMSLIALIGLAKVISDRRQLTNLIPNGEESNVYYRATRQEGVNAIYGRSIQYWKGLEPQIRTFEQCVVHESRTKHRFAPLDDKVVANCRTWLLGQEGMTKEIYADPVKVIQSARNLLSAIQLSATVIDEASLLRVDWELTILTRTCFSVIDEINNHAFGQGSNAPDKEQFHEEINRFCMELGGFRSGFAEFMRQRGLARQIRETWMQHATVVLLNSVPKGYHFMCGLSQ